MSNRLEIFAPRYKDMKVLIAKYKVGFNNEIVFTKAKHLAGKRFAIKGAKIMGYPTTTNGTIECYEVLFDDLSVVQDN